MKKTTVFLLLTVLYISCNHREDTEKKTENLLMKLPLSGQTH